MPREPIDPALHSRRKREHRFATPEIVAVHQAAGESTAPASFLPAPPETLPAAAHRHWQRLGQDLIGTGLATAPGKLELLRMASLLAYHIDIAVDSLDPRLIGLIGQQRGTLKDLFARPKGDYEATGKPPSPWDSFGGHH